MTINAQNKEIINTRNVHIHDDVLVNFDIDIISKSICLTFRSWEKEQCYTITFQNVIAFSSTCCGFWGSDEWDWAFDFEYLSPDRHRLIPALLRYFTTNFWDALIFHGLSGFRTSPVVCPSRHPRICDIPLFHPNQSSVPEPSVWLLRLRFSWLCPPSVLFSVQQFPGSLSNFHPFYSPVLFPVPFLRIFLYCL